MSNQIKIFNENCITAMKKIESHSVDLILTDPPYNLGNFMRDRDFGIKRMRDNTFVMAGWDDLDYSEWIDQMDLFFKESNRVLKKKGALLMFMSVIKVESLLNLATKHKLYYKTTGIWHKLNPMPRNMNLHFINSIEAWMYFVNESKTGTFNNESKAIHDFFETALTSSKEKKHGKHPTQKPEYLCELFIRLLSNENDTVLDPFMGSGTTGVVAERLKRNFIGIELNPDYIQIAEKRMRDVQQVLF